MQEGGEAHRAAARELVGQRLGEQGGDVVAQLPPFERGDRVEHLERVVEHVGVVELVLLHAAQGGELGQHRLRQAVVVHQAQARAHAVGGHHALELAEHALGRDLVDAGRMTPGRRAGGGVQLELELGDEPDRAQRAQRVLLERLLGHHPHEPGLEVGAAAVGIEQIAARQRLGHRVDREVARREVGLDVAVAQRDEVDVPAVAGADHAPGPEGAGELEGRAAGGAGDRLRRFARVALERDVDVVGGAAEQVVAHRAADQPRLAARERVAGGLERPGHRCSLGTRAEIPHVIS